MKSSKNHDRKDQEFKFRTNGLSKISVSRKLRSLMPSRLGEDIFYNIDSSMINLEGPSQKVQDHLSRFHRYLEAMIKQHSYSIQKHAAKELFHGESVLGVSQYHYYRQVREPIKNAEQLSELVISSAAKQTLVNCQNTVGTSFLQSSLAFLSLS